MTAFSTVSTKALLQIQENLHNGLNLVAKHLENGTFHKVGAKGAAPPAQAGQLTLWFLASVNEELEGRKR